ncbi:MULTISPECIES: hypothetical protein [Streptomyces]|uniref:Serine/threonine protein kinase n=1 Tax=Streptomyces lonegramiae TaxID=3075524 RepID=A0ABU2XJ29_9ACTN|nr:hypothetical protein [Streptomyces sp. DSM 41529]MDT0545847.1 hypothetical protein [Streptomyces sp. DSM 41529]
MDSASGGAGSGTNGGSSEEQRQRGVWILVAAALAFAVLVLPQVVEDDDKTSFAGALPSSGSSRLPSLPSGIPSGVPSGLPSGLPTSSPPSYGSGGGGQQTGGGSGGGSGGGGGSVRTQQPAAPTPAPDPTAEAFRAVSPGDCLAVYDTGRGDYNTGIPYRVGCGAGNAYMWVTGVRSSSSGCTQGSGRGYMSYTSRGQTIALCLTRQFKVGYCLLAKQSGSGQSTQMRAGLMTAVDCDAKRVPSRYNQVLHITGVYKAPATRSAYDCARVQGDRTYYWSWLVNGGRTLLCTMVYRG